jgi:hypothetical protein
MIDDLLHVANEIFIGADTPVSLACFLQAKYGEWDQLARKAIDPRDYVSPDSYKVDAQVVGLLHKCADLPTTIDREAVALDNFLESEKQCCQTNAYFSRVLNNGPFDGPADVLLMPLVQKVREEVDFLLGSPPARLDFRLGKGSTLSDRGTWCTVPHKFCSEPTITSSALHVIPEWAQTAWARNLCSEGLGEIRVCDFDKWSSVPKDALKDRGISTQPSINIAAQLAVGRFMRRQLTRRGVNLDVMQQKHRQIARAASKSGAAATIDLSNASDTVAKSVVQALLTRSWFELLNSLRVPITVLPDGKRLYLEKFSGMGNGFTFELETIIFLAICRSICGRRSENVSVYGDDIIVPTEKVEEVISALRWFGFTPNPRKTFVSGLFRESCGGDYFNGYAVRPHFQDRAPASPQDWISFANGLRRVWHEDAVFDPRFLKAWHVCLDQIPALVRACRGPAYLGDIVIHDDIERWTIRRKDSIRYIRAWIPFTFCVFEWSRFPAGAVYASALYGISNEKFGIAVGHDQRGNLIRVNGVIPRDGVTGYHRAWVPAS